MFKLYSALAKPYIYEAQNQQNNRVNLADLLSVLGKRYNGFDLFLNANPDLGTLVKKACIACPSFTATLNRFCKFDDYIGDFYRAGVYIKFENNYKAIQGWGNRTQAPQDNEGRTAWTYSKEKFVSDTYRSKQSFNAFEPELLTNWDEVEQIRIHIYLPNNNKNDFGALLVLLNHELNCHAYPMAELFSKYKTMKDRNNADVLAAFKKEFKENTEFGEEVNGKNKHHKTIAS